MSNDEWNSGCVFGNTGGGLNVSHHHEPVSQMGVITHLKAGESSWDNWFYAHPHPPWPLSLLPRGEGESVAAFLEIHGMGWWMILSAGLEARLYGRQGCLPLHEF